MATSHSSSNPAFPAQHNPAALAVALADACTDRSLFPATWSVYHSGFLSVLRSPEAGAGGGVARCGKCHGRLSKDGTWDDPGSYDQRDWQKRDGALCQECLRAQDSSLAPHLHYQRPNTFHASRARTRPAYERPRWRGPRDPRWA